MAEVIRVVGLVASIFQLYDCINAGVQKVNELYEAPAEIRILQVSNASLYIWALYGLLVLGTDASLLPIASQSGGDYGRLQRRHHL
jgi:uncharacterized protein with PQ loop repeat